MIPSKIRNSSPRSHRQIGHIGFWLLTSIGLGLVIAKAALAPALHWQNGEDTPGAVFPNIRGSGTSNSVGETLTTPPELNQASRNIMGDSGRVAFPVGLGLPSEGLSASSLTSDLVFSSKANVHFSGSHISGLTEAGELEKFHLQGSPEGRKGSPAAQSLPILHGNSTQILASKTSTDDLIDQNLVVPTQNTLQLSPTILRTGSIVVGGTPVNLITGQKGGSSTTASVLSRTLAIPAAASGGLVQLEANSSGGASTVGLPTSQDNGPLTDATLNPESVNPPSASTQIELPQTPGSIATSPNPMGSSTFQTNATIGNATGRAPSPATHFSKESTKAAVQSNSQPTAALVTSDLATPVGTSGQTNVQSDTISGGGTLYVATPLNSSPIVQISSSGSVSSFTSNTSHLNNPQGIAFLQGNLYVANNGTNTVEEFSSSGTDLGTFASTGVSSPTGLIFDSSKNLYVANQGNNTIEKFSVGGGGTVFVPTTAGLNNPEGLAFDASGNLYAASYTNNTIYKIAPSGTVSMFVSGGSLNLPFGLAFDSSGNLYVSNSGSGQILKFASTGGTLSTSPTVFASEGLLSEPQGIAFDSSGDLFVALNFSDSIEEYTESGGVLSTSGTAFVTGLNDPEFLSIPAVPVPTPDSIWLLPVAVGGVAYLRLRRIL